MNFEELLRRWSRISLDPAEIRSFCDSIPLELEGRFTLWLMDYREQLYRLMATRDPGTVN